MENSNLSKMKIEDIKVNYDFRHSRPAKEKLEQCQTHYLRHKKLDRQIVLRSDGFLKDGYVGYLIAKKFGLHMIDVVWEKSA